MRAEVELAMVRQVAERRQLTNIGMFNGEPMVRKAGNRTMKLARRATRSSSLYKLVGLVLYLCPLHRHDPPASALLAMQCAKPFIILLPALKPKTPLSELPTPLVPRPGCRVGKSIQGTLRHRSTERLI